MTETFDQPALIDRIVATLRRHGPKQCYNEFSPELVPVEPAAFAMIIGAGFSHGVVPLVNELMHEWIGDYYFPDQDMCSLERPKPQRRKDSGAFWMEYNVAAARAGLALVELDKHKLPVDCAAAYNHLFAYEVANRMFADDGPLGQGRGGYVDKPLRGAARVTPRSPGAATLGARFVRGFLRHVLAPGLEHGNGATGRIEWINAAHEQLAAILTAQQTGHLGLRPFCRTVLTTNFDSMLQAALASQRIMPVLSDRPERGFDASMFEPGTGPIHIVHVHGSVLRDNPASSTGEIGSIERDNAAVLADYLATREVLVVGHSGWNDAVVAALAARDTAHTLYWCDMHAEPTDRIAGLLARRRGPSVYVKLDSRGAGGLMSALNTALRDA
jgi:hypothetical protein